MLSGVASFRMYNASVCTTEAWQSLFEKLFLELGLTVEIIRHAWPLQLSTLWERKDLVCGFMCGWPFTGETGSNVVALAAPVPAPVSYEGLPRYRSEFLVRKDSPALSLVESLGTRIGWMSEDSQSGYQAPRATLGALLVGPRLFSASIGPLHTPKRALEALDRAEIDITAVDSFYLDLLRCHAPEHLANFRTVHYTEWTPIPLLVAARTRPAQEINAIREALLSLHLRSEYHELLSQVLVREFRLPDVSAYGMLRTMAARFPEYQLT
ncbi:phosphate/phosphite/phosphonate ABC transporter substrate-binding protein [Paraburkholderia caribensis]|uniref:phosphate/phosphite/phosphonate ABC transporter substrate-binding protein n=1 Tax=Paraburkholderia caribensis TaxID=75105 RepID=UPI001CB5EFC3|nr:PhnD/SsuA/transferrin family substrate-binding protein [Paraburkholderia caribensis]CAG9242809.1 conserved hypothetical protein [Paraburkholderia caribensis]